MTNAELKDYLDEKFNLNGQILDEKLSHINSQLITIKEQTIKTNGRVNTLESQMATIRLNDEIHSLKCPVKKEMDEFRIEIEDQLFLFRFLKKYPKLSVFLGVSTVVLLVMAIPNGIHNVGELVLWIKDLVG